MEDHLRIYSISKDHVSNIIIGYISLGGGAKDILVCRCSHNFCQGVTTNFFVVSVDFSFFLFFWQDSVTFLSQYDPGSENFCFGYE